MKWYLYSQNNSGGFFDYDPSSGITATVYVKAESADDADEYAKSIGIYFDEDGNIDCNCCGARWSPAYESEGIRDVPEPDSPPSEYARFLDKEMAFETFVHDSSTGNFYGTGKIL